MSDQPGKDPEFGQDISTLRKLYDDTIPPGKILISVTDKVQQEHHVVVPIPKSYEAALAIAFDQLDEHIPTKPGSLLEDAYLQYGMKSTSGVAVWVKLPSEFWKEIVHDGDQLMLCVKLATDDESSEVKTIAKLIELLQKPSMGIREGRIAYIPRPKSYTSAKYHARNVFYQGKQMEAIFLYVKNQEKWRGVAASTSDKDWMKVTKGNAKDVEIAVWGF